MWLSADAQQVHANVPPALPLAAAPADHESSAADDSLYLAPAPASAKSREEKRFARADRDDDGRITQAEYLAPRRRNFDKLDTNGDGKLSFEEYAASGIAKYLKADANGDQRLSAAEFATTAPKPAKARLAAAPCPPDRATRRQEGRAASAARGNERGAKSVAESTAESADEDG